MKKRIEIILIIFVIMFCCLIKVKAANFSVNVTAGSAQKSNQCRSSICSSTIGIYTLLKDEPIDGIRVILRDSSHEKIGETGNLWFTENKKNFAGGTDHIGTIFDKYVRLLGGGYKPAEGSTGGNEIFKYSEFLEKIVEIKDKDTVDTLLKKINSAYSVEDMQDYYLVIEPVFVLQYAYSTTNYYFSGTPAEIITDLLGFTQNRAAEIGWYARYFAYKDQYDCLTAPVSGKTLSGSCGNWNVIKNYFTTISLGTGFGPYINQGTTNYNCSPFGPTSALKYICQREMADTYDTNIWGKGIINISDILDGQTLIINKTDVSNTEKTVKMIGVEFYLYDSNNRVIGSCTTSADGSCSIENVPKSNVPYTLKEKLKSGYSNETSCSGCESSNGTTFTVKVNSDEPKTINITNKKTCRSEFDALSDEDKVSVAKRLELFKRYEYTNLLNFSLDISKEDPCTNAVCSNSLNIGCLSARTSTPDFSSKNLSCFEEPISVGNLTGYCGFEFKLRNKLDTNSSGYNFSSNVYFGTISSGQLFLKKTDKTIAKGEVIKTCYVYGGNENESVTDSSNYNNYIDNLEFNGLELKDHLDKDSDVSTVDNFAVYKWTYTSEYYLPKVYAHKGSGSVVYETPSDLSKYKDLGYGLTSKLNAVEGSTKVDFSFDVISEYIYDEEFEIGDVCTYDFNKEIVKNDKLDLEFRIIDVNNPFPGRNGTTRQVGQNWTYNGNNSVKNNKLIKSVITDRIDSSYRCKAKYEITLYPDDLRVIRDYNKVTSYDDYNLICDENGENCKSSFLEMLANGTLSHEGKSIGTIRPLIINTEFQPYKNKITDTTCQYTNVPYVEEERTEIILKGENPLVLRNQSFYSQDEGYLLKGNIEGISVELRDNINFDIPGNYTVEYLAINVDGDVVTSAKRKVIVPQLPRIDLYEHEYNEYSGFYFNPWNVDYDISIDNEYENGYTLTICDEYDNCYENDEESEIEITNSTYFKYTITDKYGYESSDTLIIYIIEEEPEYREIYGYQCNSMDCFKIGSEDIYCYDEPYYYYEIYDGGNYINWIEGYGEFYGSPNEVEVCSRFYEGYDDNIEEENNQEACNEIYYEGYDAGYYDWGFNAPDECFLSYEEGYYLGLYDREQYLSEGGCIEGICGDVYGEEFEGEFEEDYTDSCEDGHLHCDEYGCECYNW